MCKDAVIYVSQATAYFPKPDWATSPAGEAGAATKVVTDSTAQTIQAAQALDFSGDSGGYAVDQSSAASSQLAVLSEDRMRAEKVATALPSGQRIVHGQQLDLRTAGC